MSRRRLYTEDLAILKESDAYYSLNGDSLEFFSRSPAITLSGIKDGYSSIAGRKAYQHATGNYGIFINGIDYADKYTVAFACRITTQQAQSDNVLFCNYAAGGGSRIDINQSKIISASQQAITINPKILHSTTGHYDRIIVTVNKVSGIYSVHRYISADKQCSKVASNVPYNYTNCDLQLGASFYRERAIYGQYFDVVVYNNRILTDVEIAGLCRDLEGLWGM